MSEVKILEFMFKKIHIHLEVISILIKKIVSLLTNLYFPFTIYMPKLLNMGGRASILDYEYILGPLSFFFSWLYGELKLIHPLTLYVSLIA